MASSVIGQLRIILGLDTAQFEKGLNDAQKQLNRAGKSYQQIGRQIEGIGKSLSIGLTLPIVAIGGAALKMAADFETAMNLVEGATGASGKELKALRDQALAFGADKSITATATQAAGAMESLAKNGISTTDMLGGATRATLTLAAATGGDYAHAADLTTALMVQFGKKAGDLPKVVDEVSGALVESKLDFENYALAVAQAGAVAAGQGLSFEQFNVAIAATSASFSSGSDAGTSFKTFLQRLAPQSKQAAEMMDKLGIKFFDATGKMKPLADIAQILQDKLSGLSDKARSNALTTMFGSDSSRTAVALMNQGAAGIEKFTAAIDKASAQTQIDARLKGWAYTVNQIHKAFVNASVAIGDSGFLTGIAQVGQAVADLITAFSRLPDSVLTTIGIFAGVAAAVGPVVFIVGKLVGIWGSILSLGPRLAVAFATIASGEAAVAGGAAAAAGSMGLLEGAMAFITGPWGIAFGVIAAGLGLWALRGEKAANANAGLGKSTDTVRAAQEKYAQILQSDPTNGAAKSTAQLAAERARLAQQTWSATRAQIAMNASMAATAMLNAQRGVRMENRGRGGLVEVPLDTHVGRAGSEQGRAIIMAQQQQAAADRARKQADADYVAALKSYNAAPAAGAGAIGPKSNPDLSPFGDDKTKKHHGPSPEELARRKEETQLEVQIQALEDRGDTAKAQALRDQLDLQKRIKDYEQAGMATDAARATAAGDMKTLMDARAERQAREIADSERQLDIQNAQIAGDGETAEALQKQADLEERITYYRSEGKDLAMATAMAMADQLKHGVAIAAARMQANELEQAQRELSLAQLRGDTDERVRQLQRIVDMQQRSADLQRGTATEAPMSKADADAKAMTEAMQNEQARQQGIWRSTIQGGFRAALEGNFGDWFKNWWQDRLAKAMEGALNSVADLLYKVFSNAIGGAAGGGGGGLGGILGGIGSILGLGGPSLSPVNFGALSDAANSVKIPGFKTGGSFRVGGMSGIDQNMISFRASKDEIVDIRKPGNDDGPGGGLTMYNDFRGADAAAVAGINAKLDQLDRNLEGRAIAANREFSDRNHLIRRRG